VTLIVKDIDKKEPPNPKKPPIEPPKKRKKPIGDPPPKKPLKRVAIFYRTHRIRKTRKEFG